MRGVTVDGVRLDLAADALDRGRTLAPVHVFLGV
jgi:hypothetical protein